MTRIFASKKKAEAEGFTVDTHVYPWFAYKGERFSPTEKAECLTDRESAMCASLVKIEALCRPGQEFNIHSAIDAMCDVWNEAKPHVQQND